jgi:RNA polymerase-associated protein
VVVSVRGRSTMALYSSETSLDCHRVRFVLAEKGINVDIVNVSADESAAADLAELNPYNQAPTLVDRDLVLYDAGVINDYLDERYPHPPLMPVDPVSRAQLRLVHFRVLKDWYSLAYEIESSTGKKAEQAARQLKEGILSLVDCTLGPLFWRLSHYGVKLGKPGTSVETYAHRVFSRPSFKSSLTQAERDLMLSS